MPGPIFPLWPFPPNWSGTVTETLSWLTDVLASKTGSEQRRSLLEFPRREIEYIGLHDSRERAKLDNLLTGTGAHDWMMPLWWDIHYLDYDVNQGTINLPISTALQGEFEAGGWLVLTTGPFDSEMLQIGSINSNQIVLQDALTRDWSEGVKIYPLKRSRFTDQPQLSRKSDRTVTASYRFRVVERNLPTWPGGVISDNFSLSRNGLLARKYVPTPDGSVYDPNSGVTVGQANMILACLSAYDVLNEAQSAQTREKADIYRSFALTLLDGVVGKGQANGAILRQPVPSSPDTITLPHWLYAARGSIEQAADAGEAYELFPTFAALTGSYASAAPETFRDFDRAFALAAIHDNRGADKVAQWTVLREAFRKTNLKGRQLDDGRLVLRPLPGLPVLPKGKAEPTGMFSYSTTFYDQPNTIGIGASDSGKSYLVRDQNGDILIQIPQTGDYDVIPNFGTDGQPNGTTTISNVIVRRIMKIGREFSEAWRIGTSYQKADQFLFLEIGLNRTLDTSAGEYARVELSVGDDTYAANMDPAGITSTGVAQVFIPRGTFKEIDSGATLAAGAVIDAFAVVTVNALALTVRLRRLRMVSGDSESAVLADPAMALKGGPTPFMPGANPFRIGGYVGSNGILVGYSGSPWTGAQTPDIWTDYAGRVSDTLTGYSAGNLPLYDLASGAITYSLPATDSTGAPVPLEALLASQNLRMMRQAQAKFLADTGNSEVGPMAFTFALNRNENENLGNATPYTWLYNNYTTEPDTFWQLRAIEGVARLIVRAFTTAAPITFNGQPVTFNGKSVFSVLPGGYASDLSFEESRGWTDVVSYAKQIVDDFLTWYVNNLSYDTGIVFQGLSVTFNGQPVRYYVNGSADFLGAEPVSQLGSPADRPFVHAPNPQGMVLFLRSCFMRMQVGDDKVVQYTRYVENSWNYLERYWTETGPTAFTWFRTADDIKWYLSEFILTLSYMFKSPEDIPVSISVDLVRQRLEQAAEWINLHGASQNIPIPGFSYSYRGTSVLTTTPNEILNISVDFERMTEDYDNSISLPVQAEYTPDVWTRARYEWWMHGRTEHLDFRRMLYQIRGRAVPFWYPTHMEDLVLVEDVPEDGTVLKIQNVSYALSGGPRSNRAFLSIRMNNGTYIFREVIEAVELNDDFELLTVDVPFRLDLNREDIARVSFMEKVRFDQDGFQIGHDNGTDGVSSSSTVFRSVIER